jgi:hypothetical protein
MAIKQEANVPLLLTIGAVSGFLLLVLIIGIQAWFLNEVQNEVESKWRDVPMEPVTSQLAAQRQRITADAAVPIDQAVQIVVQNQGRLPVSR